MIIASGKALFSRVYFFLDMKTCSRMKFLGVFCLLFGVLFLLSGCQSGKTDVFRIPKEVYSVSGEDPVEMPSFDSSHHHEPGMPLHWVVPKFWEVLPVSGVRKGHFKLSFPGFSDSELTVTSFPGQAGGILPNVNRWRTQLGLSTVTVEDLPSLIENKRYGTHKMVYVSLRNAEQNQEMIVAIAFFKGESWFFKVTGATDSVDRAMSSFSFFLSSIEVH